MSRKIQNLFQKELADGMARGLAQVEAHVESRLDELTMAATHKPFDGKAFAEAFALFTAARSALAKRSNSLRGKKLGSANTRITQKARTAQTTIDAAFGKLSPQLRKFISPDALMAMALGGRKRKKPAKGKVPMRPTRPRRGRR